MTFIPPAADAPLFLVFNVAAGHEDRDASRAAIEQVLAASRRVHRLVEVPDSRQLRAVAEQTVARARAVGGIVVAVGGDGTLNAVAQAVQGSGCAFGALPQGTFNLFGRNHGLPADPAEGLRALLVTRPRPVQVGQVNERLFLVNASLGLYPDLLEDREGWKSRFGRSRGVALGAAVMTLLRHHRQLLLRIGPAGQPGRPLRTSTLFVGNNRLQLDRLGIEQAPRVEQGRLVGLMLQPVSLWTQIGLAVRGALGRLGEAEAVHSFDFDELVVQPTGPFRGQPMKIATDGEVTWLRGPLHFRVAPEPLQLMAAPPQAGEAKVAAGEQGQAPGSGEAAAAAAARP